MKLRRGCESRTTMILLAAVFLGFLIWGIVAGWDSSEITAMATATAVVGTAVAAGKPQEKS